MRAPEPHLDTVYLVAFLVGLGTAIQWAAAALRIPSLLLLLAAGILLGPVTGALDPDAIFGEQLRPLVSLAVAVVLFEGGLTLRFDEVRTASRALWRLLLATLLLSSVLIAALAMTVAGLSVGTAAVLGAILVVTGPTVILPMLRVARITTRPATLLKWEGIVNDPLGALLAWVVLQFLLLPDASTGLPGLFGMLAWRMVAATLLGVAAAYPLGKALARDLVPRHLQSPVILAGALGVYALAEAVGEETGLLGVTVMGLTLGNLRDTNIEVIHHFKEQVSTLLIAALFLLLSSRLDPDALRLLAAPHLLLVALIVFAVRPVAVLAGTIGTELPGNERLLIGWIAPRGVVAAAVAGAFEPDLLEAGYDDAVLLVPIVFGVIAATVVLHGLSLRPLALALGLGSREGSGILIVGVRRWSVALAKALETAGAEVALCDTLYHRVSRARRDGVDAHHVDVLDPEASLHLPFERMTWALVATDDDGYNAVVANDLVDAFKAGRVLQLTPDARGRRDLRGGLKAVTPWGEEGSYASIASGYWRSGEVKVTRITEEYGWDRYLADNPTALPLFAVEEGRLTPLRAEAEPPAGARIVAVRGVRHEPAGGD